MIRYDFDVVSDPQPPKPVRPRPADAGTPRRRDGAPMPEVAAGSPVAGGESPGSPDRDQ